jgi:hypothetical protein
MEGNPSHFFVKKSYSESVKDSYQNYCARFELIVRMKFIALLTKKSDELLGNGSML